MLTVNSSLLTHGHFQDLNQLQLMSGGKHSLGRRSRWTHHYDLRRQKQHQKLYS